MAGTEVTPTEGALLTCERGCLETGPFSVKFLKCGAVVRQLERGGGDTIKTIVNSHTYNTTTTTIDPFEAINPFIHPQGRPLKASCSFSGISVPRYRRARPSRLDS